MNAPKYYEYSQFNKTEEFLNKYKQRARIEGKNAEMKRFHGLARARGYGLRSVEIQAKMTAIAVNLKKIAKVFSLNYAHIFKIFLSIKNILIKKENSFEKVNRMSFFYTPFFSGSGRPLKLENSHIGDTP